MLNQFPIGPSLLFCPASRPDRYEKALTAADSVIIDLEDAVVPGRKAWAREHVREFLRRADPQRVIVRVNGMATPWFAQDLAAIQGFEGAIMLPKAEDPDGVASLSAHAVIALCETARGVAAAERLASVDNVIGLLWGGEDLTADLGGRSTRDVDGEYYDHVRYIRSRILVAAGAARKVPIDGAFLDVQDGAGLERETVQGAAMGFKAKIAIHPRQAEIIRRGFRPTPAQLQWARAVKEAVATHDGEGVFVLDGRMIDGPIIGQAEAYLAAAPARKGD